MVRGVRWYRRYVLSDRDGEALLWERRVAVDHSTVGGYRALLLNSTSGVVPISRRRTICTEMYIEMKKKWYYLCRVVESEGSTIDVLLCATRDAQVAEWCFRKVLRACHPSPHA